MFTNLINCPECSGIFIPDTDLTIANYSEDYKEKYRIMVMSIDPPELFNYIIFKCQNKECNFKKKYSYSEMLSLITKKWSEIAWTLWRQEMRNGVSFEEYFTRYLIDNNLKASIEDIERFNNNDFIKDLLKYGKSS
jgi:hypothetical protein